MLNRIQFTLVQWSDPRKATLLLSLLFLGLALTGCGDVVPACPAGGSGGSSCSGG
jgi:hypothetical protein